MAGGLGLLASLIPAAAQAGSLRFHGHGGSPGDDFVFPDRVKIAAAPPSAVNVGAGDFTIEFWMRASAAENPNPGGPASSGPDGDLSYPEDAVLGAYCSPDGGSGSESCQNSDPFLVFGAEKHGFSGINYAGWLDEVRLSSAIRYASPFAAPTAAFVPDAQAAALYHFDEGAGSLAEDAAGSADGQIFFGGAAPSGPEWSSLSPFGTAPPVPALAGLARFAPVAALAAAAWTWSARP